MKKKVIALILIVIGGAGSLLSRRFALGLAADLIFLVMLFLGLVISTASWVKDNPPKEKKDNKNNKDPML